MDNVWSSPRFLKTEVENNGEYVKEKKDCQLRSLLNFKIRFFSLKALCPGLSPLYTMMRVQCY